MMFHWMLQKKKYLKILMLFNRNKEKPVFFESWFFFSVLCLITLLLAHPLTVSAAPRVQETRDNIVIVIDPGHGGENFGTIEGNRIEKEMTLITAMAMYEELCKYDNVTVYMTRTEDVDMTLAARAEFAAALQADFLFSIHYNASVKHDLFGSEVWIPAGAPYNAYGYQFGYGFLRDMEEKGLFLRGIKTKLNEQGADYYGIIRESTALSVPSVIIEHCHVDEERDASFCDEEEELIAFGIADATAVAKYFGLKSEALGVDYSLIDTYPEASENRPVQATLADETIPDVCIAELGEIDPDTGDVELHITAADYDSPLMYYTYSYDGGNTFHALQEWPGYDTFQGSYQDTFSIHLQIPSGVQPRIVFRAYNMFDRYADSETVNVLHRFVYGEEPAATEEVAATAEAKPDKELPGTTTFMPDIEETPGEAEGVSFFTFLQLCLGIALALLLMVLITKMVTLGNRRKKRLQRKKEAGNSKNHPR